MEQPIPGVVRGATGIGSGRGRRVLTLGVAPSLVYLAFFCLYTWPWAIEPTGRFFTDSGDGYQNVWNLWWVDRAVTALHQLPWHTDLLHFPYGTTLLGQTMNPFNGFVGIVLLRVMPLVVAFNLLVVFSFVGTGLSTFWLCREFCGRWAPSVVGGFVMTFSAYHLSKTLGLMQLVSLEWVPLFVLLWWRLLHRPRLGSALGTACTLLLVLLCDDYYFLFSVVVAAAVLVHLHRRRELRLDRRVTVAFVVAAAVLTVPFPAALVLSNLRDPMVGGHASMGTDAATLVLDGGRWRFASLTRWYWGAVHVGAGDGTVYLSATVTVLLAVAWRRRRLLGGHAGFWLLVAGVATVLSLGPTLVLHGADTGIPLPFDLLRLAVPLLDYNLEPVRIMVVTTLAAAVLVALVLTRLAAGTNRGRVLAGAACAALVIELWPAPPPEAPVGRPAYVSVLARLPAGAVIDDAAVRDGRIDKSLQLYDQVLDGKPLAFGYISRTPSSVAAADARIQSLLTRQRYTALCALGFRYLTVPPGPALRLALVYRDATATIYRVCEGAASPMGAAPARSGPAGRGGSTAPPPAISPSSDRAGTPVGHGQ